MGCYHVTALDPLGASMAGDHYRVHPSTIDPSDVAQILSAWNAATKSDIQLEMSIYNLAATSSNEPVELTAVIGLLD